MFHDLLICFWSIFQCYHDVTERLLLHIACKIILCIMKMLCIEGQITSVSAKEFVLHLEFIVLPELQIIRIIKNLDCMADGDILREST